VIFGVGLDIVDVERVAQQLSRHAGLREQVYTADEISYCSGRPHAARHFAARFAAKEAFLKALGLGLGAGIGLNEIEVATASGGPALRVHGSAATVLAQRGIRRTRLSLACPARVASAIVILEI